MLLCIFLPLIFLPRAAAQTEKPNLHLASAALKSALTSKPQPAFPNMAGNYQTMQTAQADCEAQGGTFSITGCAIPPPPPPPPPAPVWAAPVYDGLIGQIGWSLPGGNCVNEPGVNNPGWGNPIDWPATSYQPWIGATVLFTWNHTAVITGIWSNGDIEVAQENAPGFPHRIPSYMVRGYR